MLDFIHFYPMQSKSTNLQTHRHNYIRKDICISMFFISPNFKPVKNGNRRKYSITILYYAIRLKKTEINSSKMYYFKLINH